MKSFVVSLVALAVCVSTHSSSSPGAVIGDRPVVWRHEPEPVKIYVGAFQPPDRDRLISSIQRAIKILASVGAPRFPALEVTDPVDQIPTFSSQAVVTDFHYATTPASFERSIVIVPHWKNTPPSPFEELAATFPGYRFEKENDWRLGRVVVAVRPFDRSSNLDLTILHELGHALGLSHSLIHSRQEIIDPTFVVSADIPALYPVTIRSSLDLHTSDQAWLSYLYKDGALKAPYGSFVGNLTASDGKTAISGLNIVAIRVGPDDELSRTPVKLGANRYSGVSGSWPSGGFVIPATRGSYELFVHSVPTPSQIGHPSTSAGFGGSSRIGPGLVGKAPGVSLALFGEPVEWQQLDVFLINGSTEIPLPGGRVTIVPGQETRIRVQRRLNQPPTR